MAGACSLQKPLAAPLLVVVELPDGELVETGKGTLAKGGMLSQLLGGKWSVASFAPPDPKVFDGFTPYGVPEITVEALKAKMDRGEDFDLLDVRESNEFQICRIQGATLIPLGELSRRTAELDPGRDLVVHCKVGARSAKAVALLQERGFTRVHNLKGGILAWIDRIDPSQSRY